MAIFRGKQVFKSEGELNTELRKKMTQVQDKTMEKVYNKLVDYIQRVYWHNPPEEKDDPFYQRTESLLHIWETKKSYYHGGTYGGVYGGIGINENEFKENTNPENRGWEHASHTYPFSISAIDFVNIINNGVSANHSIFGERKAIPFWDRFLEIMDKSYSDLYVETAREMGIELVGEGGYGKYYDYKRKRKGEKGSTKSVSFGVEYGDWTEET